MAEEDPGAGRNWKERNWAIAETLIRLAERIARYQHPVDKARAWAESTLRKAGLPTAPGLYAPDTNGGLILIPQREGARVFVPDMDAAYPWQQPLHEALFRLGYACTSPEYLAARLLRERMLFQGAYDAGDRDQIAGTACMIGRLHVQGQDQKLTEARAKQRAGGKASGEARGKYTEKEKLCWVLRFNELKRNCEKAGQDLTDTDLADKVAKEFKVAGATVRKLLPPLLSPGSRRKRGRPKKAGGKIR